MVDHMMIHRQVKASQGKASHMNRTPEAIADAVCAIARFATSNATMCLMRAYPRAIAPACSMGLVIHVYPEDIRTVTTTILNPDDPLVVAACRERGLTDDSLYIHIPNMVQVAWAAKLARDLLGMCKVSFGVNRDLKDAIDLANLVILEIHHLNIHVMAKSTMFTHANITREP